MTPASSPRLALWIVARFAPADWRESMAGDLLEEHGRRLKAGDSVGPWWAVSTAVRTCARLAIDRYHRRLGERSARSLRLGLSLDLRQTLRALAANRGYSATAVLTIALGIGVTAAVFSVSNALLLRPIAGVTAPSRMVTMFFGPPQGYGLMSVPELDELAKGTPALAGIAGSGHVQANLGREGIAKRINLAVVSGNYFDILGHAIGQGRAFTSEEGRNPRAEPVVVIADALWRQAFAGAPLLGRPVTINGDRWTVVGVGARDFAGLSRTERTDAWAPVAQYMRLEPGLPNVFTTPRARVFDRLTARLAPQATADNVAAEADVVRARLAAVRPTDFELAHWRYVARPGVVDYDGMRQRLSRSISIVGGFVALLLLLACANVANLILMRALGRRAELSTHAALGASRARIIRLVLFESAALAITGGASGLGLCVLASRAMVGVVVLNGVSPLGHAPLDWRVLSVAAGLAGFVAVAAGVLPAVAGSRSEMLNALRDTSRSQTGSRGRLRHLMAAFQVAVSLTLLVGAGLLTRSMAMRHAINIGFDPSRVLAFSVDPGLQHLNGRAREAFYRDLLDRTRAMPGVRATSVVQMGPLSLKENDNDVHAEGQTAANDVSVEYNFVTSGFFRSLGLPIIAGRDFTQAETFQPQVTDRPVIISASLATKLFRNAAAVGRQVVLKFPPNAVRVVVGVVADIRDRQVIDPAEDKLFEPFDSDDADSSTVLIALDHPSDARALAGSAQQVVAGLDPGMPIYDVGTLDGEIARQLASDNLLAELARIFAGLATLLAAVGLYGVVARGVAERRREFGIRMALGARPARVARLVAGEATRVVLMGAVVGGGTSLLLARLLEHQLFEVRPWDPVAALAAITLLITVTLAATQPAVLRATRIDPAKTLRE